MTAYQKYLQSPEWHLLRRQRLAMDNHECVLCGSIAEHVHHRRYPDVLGTETVLDLVSLCGDCHARFHGMDGSLLKLPRPPPPTDEMVAIRDQMRMSEQQGDEERSTELFVQFIRMRRVQIVG